MTSNRYQDAEPDRPDLIGRTYRFARDVRIFVNRVPKTLGNYEDSKQLVRSSGSVAANYLESQEALSRKDFFFRVRICRKEARESGLWLRLLELGEDGEMMKRRIALMREANELKKIFAAIAAKDDPTG